MLRLIFRYSTKRVINLFAVFAILLSITNLFTVNAVFKGFHAELSTMFRGSMADYNLEWPWFSPRLGEVEKKLEGWTWAPMLESFGLMSAERFDYFLRFKGVDPKKQKVLQDKMGITNVPFDKLEGLVSGGEDSEEDPTGGLISILNSHGGAKSSSKVYPALIGKMMSKLNHINIGDRFDLVVLDSSRSRNKLTFEITGIFNSGIWEDDKDLALIPLEAALELKSIKDGYGTIQVVAKTEDDHDALNKIFPNARVSTWLSKHEFHLRAVAHEQKMIAIIMSLIVIVSSFAILAIQWSFVQEKISDIGILRALGYSTGQVFFIFIGVSWLIGITGLILGLGSGYLLSANANEIINFTGWNPLPKDMFYHEKVPVEIHFSDMVWISILSLSVTTVAGLLPAWRAIRIEPIQAMSYE